MKTADLTGNALDWAVAQCEGRTGQYWMNDSVWGNYSPSTRWALGGEIIEREGIDTRQIKCAPYQILEVRQYSPVAKGDVLEYLKGFNREMVKRPQTHPLNGMWMARMSEGTGSSVFWRKADNLSPTPLIAAMRCYVASKMGDEIEIPADVI
jgi:hypothetical protein